MTAPAFDPSVVNDVLTKAPVGPKSRGPAVLRAQILLDRAHFASGEIDGHYGNNLRMAILGYQAARKLPATGTVDAATWALLNADPGAALVTYTITPEDVAGPFVAIPAGMTDKAGLQSLGYESIEEELSERFHVDPKLLVELNRGKDLNQPGEQILAPDVNRSPQTVRVHRIVVFKNHRIVQAQATDGTVLAQYPASSGSSHDPLPIGDWKVTKVQQNPWFNYNPDLFWDSTPEDAKARIAPGPNNPVGVVWIGLTKEHYGIHGTPEPATIGRSQSHGCIRLTNWDAEELAKLATPGTLVQMKE